jgi:hypothetical protein
MALEIFAIAFGRFFIRSPVEVNAIMLGPNGFWLEYTPLTFFEFLLVVADSIFHSS